MQGKLFLGPHGKRPDAIFYEKRVRSIVKKAFSLKVRDVFVFQTGPEKTGSIIGGNWFC